MASAPVPDLICYSIRQAATVTGLRRATITLAIKDGTLAAFKIGVRVKILRSDLEAWIKTMPRHQ